MLQITEDSEEMMPLKVNINSEFYIIKNQYGLGFYNAFKNCKNSAIKRNYNFNLNFIQVYKLFKDKCYYCGIAESNNSDGFTYNGIDRVDNNRGYELDNCITACRTCNCAKNKMTLEEFQAYIKRIKNKYNKQNTSGMWHGF